MTPQYFAGLFDGEGCVYIQKHTRRNGKNPDIEVRATIANTHYGVLETVRKQYGGTISEQPFRGRRKRCWCIHIASNKAHKFFQDIYPFSIIKQKKIALALELQPLISGQRLYIKGIKGSSVDPKILQKREKLFLKWKN